MMKGFDELFKGWISGTLNEKEIDELLQQLQDDDNPWSSHIDDLLQNITLRKLGNEAQRERIYHNITQRRLESKKTRRIFRMLATWPAKWAAAAVFILLAGIGYWLYQSNKFITTNVPVAKAPAGKQELLPGGNTAVLTLSDGSKIILDSSQNGRLAQQDGAIVLKSDNGEITYQEAGTSSTQKVLPVYNTLSTPRGGQYKIVLPDGTSAWLNAASSITYPTAFTGAERKVTITGEVYFEVIKNAAMPFKVLVKQMEITVLGTHFNINAYNDEAGVKTTLLEGSVKVAAGSNMQMLAPGQQAQVSGDVIQLFKNINIDEIMAWQNGYFYFDNTDLQTIMRQLARWYDVTVEYKGKIPDMKFNGEIPRNINATKALKILAESGVHFTIREKKIIVTQ